MHCLAPIHVITSYMEFRRVPQDNKVQRGILLQMIFYGKMI